MAPKNFCVAPLFRVLIRTCFWRPFKSLLASILGGVRARFSMIFGWFLELLGLLWACFRPLLLGGLRPPRPPRSWHGFRRSWWGLQPTLPRKSKNLPRTKPRIQEPAEDKAEKKIRTNAFRKTQISKLSSSSKLPSLSQGSRLRKLWAAVLPPGGLQ